MARNALQQEYPDQRAFLYSIGPRQSFTADRTEFFGRNGDPSALPATTGKPLFGKVGPGMDPCLAQQCRLEIEPGSTVEIVFVLGCGRNIAETQELAKRYASIQEIRAEIDRTTASWDKLLNTIQVKTPNRAFDLLVNRWLLYQILSCRIWGRSGYYQSGGAYGFRDQLQDVMAFVYAKPALVREHILRCAARQYVQGDVQHWWHPPTGRGTRTKFSDDLLWMPFVVCHYVRVTGDAQILDEVVPFLESPLLTPEEEERYETPTVSSEQASLYEHCCRAINHSFKFGEHGLPLMGCGDWNDGMNKVGAHGKGESVWVGWFLVVLLEQFIPLMKSRGDEQQSNEYRTQVDTLRKNIETNAWDGEWYRRAFFDDGTPLGSKENDECQIDSIVQTWAIMANANPERTDQALENVFERLVNLRSRIVMLFTPPFDKTALDPGYIKGYLPGVRENGGQYTHPVLWLIHALTLKEDGNRAMQIFDLINPILHASEKNVGKYQVEPYVIPADVYSIAPHEGRGGWTWYTGSASWAYRVAIESILGLQITNGNVEFKPCASDSWDKFEVTLNLDGTASKYVFKSGESSDARHGKYYVLTNGLALNNHADDRYSQIGNRP
jgi:cyclic beta-1,2-glucan synthetase